MKKFTFSLIIKFIGLILGQEQQKGGAGMNRELAKLQFFGAGPKAAVFDPDALGKKSKFFPFTHIGVAFIAFIA